RTRMRTLHGVPSLLLAALVLASPLTLPSPPVRGGEGKVITLPSPPGGGGEGRVRGAAADPPSSLELVQTIVLKGKAGKLDHLALDSKRERLFLANTSNGTLDVVDLKAGKLLKQVTGQPGIQGVAYAADLDRVFVGLGTGGLCNVFDGANYRPLKTIKFA